MPRQDQTGPQGKGPRTGRGMGTCKSTSSAPSRRGVGGRGTGRRVGRRTPGRI